MPYPARPAISFGFLTYAPFFMDPNNVRELFTLWHKFLPEIFPNRWGFSPPYRMPMSGDHMPDFVELSNELGVWEFRRTKPPLIYGTVGIWDLEIGLPALSGLTVHCDYASGMEDSILEFLQAANKAFIICFAYVHRVNDYDVSQGYALEANDKDLKIRVTMIHSWLIEKGLPNLFWATMLGLPFVEKIGRHKLSTCGAYETIWPTPDSVILKVSGSVNDCVDDAANFDKERTKLRNTLGLQNFQPDSCKGPEKYIDFKTWTL
jgi:hypothetical protein